MANRGEYRFVEGEGWLQHSYHRQVCKGQTQSPGKSEQGENGDIIVSSLDLPNVTPIHVCQQRQLFLRNTFLQPYLSNSRAKGDEVGMLTIFGEVWHAAIVAL